MHIYGIQKDSTDEPICRAAMKTETEKRLTDMGGGEEEREGTTLGVGNMETYITICKIDSQWEFAV